MKGFDETEKGSASIWTYLPDGAFLAEIKLKYFQKSILDCWRRSQDVEDGEDERMVARYSMQGHRASLVFLRTSGKVISEDHALDYNEDRWESGWMGLHNCITQVKLK